MRNLLFIVWSLLELSISALFGNAKFGNVKLLQLNPDDKTTLVGGLYIAVAALSTTLGIIFALWLKSNNKLLKDKDKSADEKLRMAQDKLDLSKKHQEEIEDLLKKNITDYQQIIERHTIAYKDERDSLKTYTTVVENHLKAGTDAQEALAKLIRKHLKIDD